MWKGGAFDCAHNANTISLLHFNIKHKAGECNDGDIVAFGVQSVDGCYTSRLNITMVDGIQMKSVECAVDYGNSSMLLLIGNTNLPRIGEQNGFLRSVLK